MATITLTKCSLHVMLVLGVLLVQNSDCDTATSTSTSLGETFNIQTIAADGVISGGKSVFVDLDPSCFHTEELHETTKNLNAYSDHENFVNEMALSIGLTAKELEGKGDMMKSSSTDISGTVVEVLYLRQRDTISDECLEEATLDPHIKRDLNKLPYPIIKPHERSHWVAYEAFIHKWGSHVLKSTDSGAKAVYHTKTTKKSTADKADLTAKLCEKLPDLDLAGCASTGPKKASNEDKSDEVNDVTVSGGSVETQDKLRAGQFTPEVLDMLGAEAAQFKAPIKHQWSSLPELLVHRAMFDSEAEEWEAERAMALLAYYKGYHVFGCDHQVVEGQDVTLFVNQGDDSFPDFKCLQMRPGCMRDSDCVNWPVKYMGPCYCAGKSCIAVKKEGILGTKSTELTRRYLPTGRSSDNINYHCKWQAAAGSKCFCDRGELEEVWPLGPISLKSTQPHKRINWTMILIVLGIVLPLVACYWHCLCRSCLSVLLDKSKEKCS